MKNLKTKTWKYLLLSMLPLFCFISACKKDLFDSEAPRIFRPTLKGNLASDGNYIEASWTTIKDAKSYLIQISQDSFKTVSGQLTLDTSYAILEKLKWNQLYQLRVKALAGDSVKNSGFSDLGAIKTPKFPSILSSVSASDLLDNIVRVKWTNSGAPVTSLKVYLASDSSFVKDVNISATDINNQYKDVFGLTGSTTYIIYLYSGGNLRGWDNYTTKAALTGTIVDLRGIANRPNVLFDTLATVDAGSTILLERGLTYNIPQSFTFTKSVKIMSGSGFGDKAKISMVSGNFDINGTIDFLRFEDITISQGGTAAYFINVGYVAKVSELSFENVVTEGTFANSFVRLKTAGDEISKLIINNCIISDFGISTKYALIFANASSSAKIDDISITNSTISKLYYFVRQDGVTCKALKIDQCTFNNIVDQSGYFVNYSVGNPSSFTLSNTIIGKTKDPLNSNWIKSSLGLPAITNTYYTTDAIYSANRLIGVATSATAYNGTAATLFVDPDNSNFRFKDVSFAGRNSAGDPRWR